MYCTKLFVKMRLKPSERKKKEARAITDNGIEMSCLAA